jgi:hypothetical protein
MSVKYQHFRVKWTYLRWCLFYNLYIGVCNSFCLHTTYLICATISAYVHYCILYDDLCGFSSLFITSYSSLTRGGFFFSLVHTESLFNAFATAAFFKFVVFSIFEMRYLLAIWKASRPLSNGEGWETMRRELSVLYSRFCKYYEMQLLCLSFQCHSFICECNFHFQDLLKVFHTQTTPYVYSCTFTSFKFDCFLNIYWLNSFCLKMWLDAKYCVMTLIIHYTCVT